MNTPGRRSPSKSRSWGQRRPSSAPGRHPRLPLRNPGLARPPANGLCFSWTMSTCRYGKSTARSRPLSCCGCSKTCGMGGAGGALGGVRAGAARGSSERRTPTRGCTASASEEQWEASQGMQMVESRVDYLVCGLLAFGFRPPTQAINQPYLLQASATYLLACVLPGAFTTARSSPGWMWRTHCCVRHARRQAVVAKRSRRGMEGAAGRACASPGAPGGVYE
jgi:hypothetical protein